MGRNTHIFSSRCSCKKCTAVQNRAARELRDERDRISSWRDTVSFGTGEVGGGPTSTHPVHGADAQGNPVTASFANAGDTYLRDGHAKSESDFWGPQGAKEHDHYGSGNGRNDNGTQRGKYTGHGS